MRFEFIREHAATWPIRLMCRVLQVSASGYYAWRVRPDSARRIANRHLLGDIRRLEAEHRGRYGSSRMHAALRAEGQTVSRGRIERLMRHNGIRALAGRWKLAGMPWREQLLSTQVGHLLPVTACSEPDVNGSDAPARLRALRSFKPQGVSPNDCSSGRPLGCRAQSATVSQMVLATLTATNPVWPHPSRERLSFPTQSHQSLDSQLINRGVNRRHQFTPTCHCPLSAGRCEQRSSYFAWTDRLLCCAGGEKCQSSVACVQDHHPPD